MRAAVRRFAADFWWGFTHAAQVIREVWKP